MTAQLPEHSPPERFGPFPPMRESDDLLSEDHSEIELVVIEKSAPCQDALADIEIHIYEAWTFEKITKDAARHFLVIAEICDWDMPWVEEMREWAA